MSLSKIIPHILLVLSLASCGRGHKSWETGDFLVLDSIYCRDPFIVADKNTKTYYLYRSSTTAEGLGGVEAFRSSDLEKWYGPERVFTVPADNSLTGSVWAPEVHFYKGKWYLFATLNTDKTWADKVEGWPSFTYRGTQIFRADSPSGPFLPLGKDVTTPKDYMALDGTPWIEDGVPYMVFCHEWVQVVDGTYEVIRLKEDLSGTIGDPTVLFKASDAKWTKGLSEWKDDNGDIRKSYVSDGPFLYRTNGGELLMLWSSFNDTYCVGIARSTSGRLEGPWTCDEEPIVEEDGGHSMLFHDFDGNINLVFHRPNSGFSHPVILPLKDTGKTLEVL